MKYQLCRNTHEWDVHTRTMKMPFQNLFILGFVHPFSWEILWIIKKVNRTAKTGGGFTTSLSNPPQDIILAGFTKIRSNSECLGIVPIPTGKLRDSPKR
jgi:hypothetical protein